MKPLAALIFGVLTISNSLAASPEIIIETVFEEADAVGRPLTTAAPSDIGELPLRMPTKVVEEESAGTSPSQARVGKEDFGLVKPPYLILQAGESPTEIGMLANVEVQWDLRKLDLFEGRYEISFDMAACQADKTGGAFRLVFGSKTPNFLAEIPPGALPGSIWFFRAQMLVSGARNDGQGGPVVLPYQADEVYHCVLRVDLDKRMWSCEINGAPVVETQKMPDSFQQDAADALSLSGLSFGSQRGLAAQADARFILANVKVTKLEK